MAMRSVCQIAPSKDTKRKEYREVVNESVSDGGRMDESG